MCHLLFCCWSTNGTYSNIKWAICKVVGFLLRDLISYPTKVSWTSTWLILFLFTSNQRPCYCCAFNSNTQELEEMCDKPRSMLGFSQSMKYQPRMSQNSAPLVEFNTSMMTQQLNLVNTSPVLLTVCWMIQGGKQTISHHWELCNPAS